ncbi:MAG: 30S ribosomal protein S6--L-glutamate ligase, partial [Chloroflexota bacterium]
MLISILSRDARLYSTRRLVEAARRRNHRVDVVNPLDLRVELGEVYGPLHRELGALVPRIGASITEYGCAILRQLEQRGHWSLNPSYGITNSRDKLTSLQIMQGE